MNFGSFALALIKTIATFLEWARERNLINAGHARAIAEQAKKIEAIVADAARVDDETEGMSEEALDKELETMYRD